MLAKISLPKSATLEHVILIAAGVLIVALLIGYIINFKIKINYHKRWKEVQKLLADKATWTDAIIEADHLLDLRLKKRHFKGKTMGERLVSAQHELTANDMVWFSHKLSNKVASEEAIKVSKTEVKKCLLGYWRALKDLGAFTKDEK